MALYSDIFGRLDWLTKTVKRLCCAVDQVKEEAAQQAVNNPCYVEFVWDDIANVPFDTLAGYNGAISGDSTGLYTPFTALVTSGNSQRLYGGSHIILDTGLLVDTTHLISINDPCGTFTEVGDSALRNNTLLSFVNMVGVLEIRDYAFENDTALSYINFPNVTVIANNAFNNCTGLISLDFPKLEQIGNDVFKGCNSVNYINLPTVTTIGSQSFQGMTGYSTVLNLPNVITIGSSCFNNFYSCTGFNLPKVENIGSDCFNTDIYAQFYYMPKCTNLGGSTGDDGVWNNITSRPFTIDLTIPVALMTCDSGNPDGDLVWLQANNNTNLILV